MCANIVRSNRLTNHPYYHPNRQAFALSIVKHYELQLLLLQYYAYYCDSSRVHRLLAENTVAYRSRDIFRTSNLLYYPVRIKFFHDNHSPLYFNVSLALILVKLTGKRGHPVIRTIPYAQYRFRASINMSATNVRKGQRFKHSFHYKFIHSVIHYLLQPL